MGRAEDIFEKIVKEGLDGIEEFIITRESESLFLDFKRSANNGEGERLDQNDRQNLSKAISGFGNSEGGIIVWGIDCSQDATLGDVACAKVPIKKPSRFVSWLQGVVSGCTIPPHSGVQNHPILIPGSDEGYVLTYIPKSDHAPHQVIVKGKGEYRYYIRAGSDFVPTPHAVLAGLFGRRPQPYVYHNYTYGPPEFLNDETIKVTIGFMIFNQGSGIASNLFMNAKVILLPGENCKVSFAPPDEMLWVTTFIFKMAICAISKRDVYLPPEAWLQPITMTFIFKPPFSESLLIDCSLGSGQSPLTKFKLENDCESFRKIFDELIQKKKTGILTSEDLYNFVKNAMKPI